MVHARHKRGGTPRLLFRHAGFCRDAMVAEGNMAVAYAVLVRPRDCFTELLHLSLFTHNITVLREIQGAYNQPA